MPNHVLRHFKGVDPVLYDKARAYTKKGGRLAPETSRDPFVSLCRSIVGQQLSGKAARTIWMRFEALFPKKRVTPKSLATMKHETLRSAGLSNAKARAVRELAQKIVAREFSFTRLHGAPEHEVRDALCALRGVGPWTAEMFMMFSLGYEDVFSPGDLGLRKGIRHVYNLRTMPTEKQAIKRAATWAPFRTYASCVLWCSIDNGEGWV